MTDSGAIEESLLCAAALTGLLASGRTDYPQVMIDATVIASMMWRDVLQNGRACKARRKELLPLLIATHGMYSHDDF